MINLTLWDGLMEKGNFMNKILVFIPMYNCEKQIVRVLGQFDKKVLRYISQIVVVDNRSTDNSEEAAVEFCRNHSELPVKILRNDENYGLGGSHKVAFEYAIDNRFDYVIVLHGDDQGSIKDLIPILKNRRYCDYDCCLGARFTRKSKLIGYSKFRIFGNCVFNIIFSIVMKRKIYDLGAGLNMYSINMLKKRYFYTYPDNLTFNVYMLMATKTYGQKYCFFPLSWREIDQVSNAKVMGQAAKTLQMAVKFSQKGKSFLETDSRDKKIKRYTYSLVYGGEKA